MAGAPRNTRQKQAVYDALLHLDHPTATQVYEYVHTTHPTLSRGTVFRVLGAFAAGGQVRRVTLEGSDARFDHTLAPHAHGRCRVCGRVCDIFCPITPPLRAAPYAADFISTGARWSLRACAMPAIGNKCAKAQEKEG